jgi:hypothetical protein
VVDASADVHHRRQRIEAIYRREDCVSKVAGEQELAAAP